MAFESGVVPEDWRSAVIVPMYEAKGKRTECRNIIKQNSWNNRV